MIRWLLPVILFFSTMPAIAQTQEDEVYVRVERDKSGRSRNTLPPYGYEKLKQLTSNGKKLSQGAFDSLSIEEKFTYCMGFPEQFSQICSSITFEKPTEKIFLYLPFTVLGYAKSERQWNFLRENDTAVFRLMRQTISDSSFIGLNYKTVIRALKLTQLITELVHNYEAGKDHDVLTLLINLMDENGYGQFMSSEIAKAMKERKLSIHKAFIPFNEKNEAQIIKLAWGLHGEECK